MTTSDRNNEVVLAYCQTLQQLAGLQRRWPQAVGAIGIVSGHAQLKVRMTMIAQAALPTRVQAVLAAMLLMLFGVVAFSMPTIESATSQAAVAMIPAVETAVAGDDAPVMSVVTGTTVSDAGSMASRPMMVADKSAKTAVVVDRVVDRVVARPEARVEARPAANQSAAAAGFVSEPGLAVALADTSTQAVPLREQATEVVETKPEVYPDLPAIRTLTNAVTAARDAGVTFVIALNAKAEACRWDDPEMVLSYEYTFLGCGDLYRALMHKDEIADFWSRCVDFITTYNKLFVSLPAVGEHRFTDLDEAKSLMQQDYQTLGEFCSLDTYRQKYPKVVNVFAFVENFVAKEDRRRQLAFDQYFTRQIYLASHPQEDAGILESITRP